LKNDLVQVVLGKNGKRKNGTGNNGTEGKFGRIGTFSTLVLNI